MNECTILSAVDTLGEAQDKLDIAKSVYSSLVFQHFDPELKANRNNEAAFFVQRDTIRREMSAVMEFVAQAYRDVVTVLESLEAEREKPKE